MPSHNGVTIIASVMTKVHYGVIDYIKRSWRYKVKRLYCKRDCQTREFQLSGQLIPCTRCSNEKRRVADVSSCFLNNWIAVVWLSQRQSSLCPLISTVNSKNFRGNTFTLPWWREDTSPQSPVGGSSSSCGFESSSRRSAHVSIS